ncbi:hypothetical protein Tdes44962_MAKER06974 [Teratosphaeria destructans]|uniref:Uncharacterized protein n=1 Tax=Teratosphaeria destructans TaxID=418781 RepID=A0A9W7T0S4_9PEZI|nr:hypothetical protein Tdes44962_MAKER06974 [Teratosphaeria destructans]
MCIGPARAIAADSNADWAVLRKGMSLLDYFEEVAGPVHRSRQLPACHHGRWDQALLRRQDSLEERHQARNALGMSRVALHGSNAQLVATLPATCCTIQRLTLNRVASGGARAMRFDIDDVLGILGRRIDTL